MGAGKARPAARRVWRQICSQRQRAESRATQPPGRRPIPPGARFRPARRGWLATPQTRTKPSGRRGRVGLRGCVMAGRRRDLARRGCHAHHRGAAPARPGAKPGLGLPPDSRCLTCGDTGAGGLCMPRAPAVWHTLCTCALRSPSQPPAARHKPQGVVAPDDDGAEAPPPGAPADHEPTAAGTRGGTAAARMLCRPLWSAVAHPRNSAAGPAHAPDARTGPRGRVAPPPPSRQGKKGSEPPIRPARRRALCHGC